MSEKHEQKLTIRQAADYTGFTTQQIGHAAKCVPPKLRGFKAGPYGPWYFTCSDLDEWVASMANIPEQREEPTTAPRQARRNRVGVAR